MTLDPAEVERLRRVERHAREVMAALEQYGESIVGHLLDTDDNSGEFLRRALNEVAPYAWEFCRSCGGAGWVGARVDHRHPDCGHRCILCDPPPGYDRTYAKEAASG
jgi:hypothetical protein